MKTIPYVVRVLMTASIALMISCDMRSDEDIAIQNKRIEYRSIQVLTIEGDTVTIRGGATCHIYKDPK